MERKTRILVKGLRRSKGRKSYIEIAKRVFQREMNSETLLSEEELLYGVILHTWCDFHRKRYFVENYTETAMRLWNEIRGSDSDKRLASILFFLNDMAQPERTDE